MEARRWSSKLRDTLLGFVLGGVACGVLSWLLPRCGVEAEGNETVTSDTIRDTVTVREPVVRDSVLVRTVVRELPVVRTDTVRIASEVQRDTMSVEIPITQKVYSDSLYDAWVSGYEARLDSIRIKRETVTVTKRVPKRWGMGVQAGVGTGGAYVGVGITYNILNF
jgi:hypothetical protein